MRFFAFFGYTCQILLDFLIVLLLLREILPLFSQHPMRAEYWVNRLTEPLHFAADCFCRMFGIPLDAGGIDARCPVAVGTVLLAVWAISLRDVIGR